MTKQFLFVEFISDVSQETDKKERKVRGRMLQTNIKLSLQMADYLVLYNKKRKPGYGKTHLDIDTHKHKRREKRLKFIVVDSNSN